MLCVLLLVAITTVSSLECYVDFEVKEECVSPDSTEPRCATVTTVQGKVEVACRSVLVCEFYEDLVEEVIIQSYSCCDQDGCNDPGEAPPTTNAPGAVNATDPDDPIYRCSPYSIWPAYEGTAEECVEQHGGSECVFCAIQNGNQIIQTCSPRFNYSCFLIEHSHEIHDGYCNAGWACPAGTVAPSFLLLAAIGVSFLFSLLKL